MKVAIITVNYNGKKDTLELLESLKSLKTEGCELKTIVIDNASSDGLVRELREVRNVDVLQTGANLGFSGGYNKGIQYAQIWGADYFLLINNDCLIKDSNLVEELIKTAKSDSKIGLVSPKIYFAPGFEFHKEKYTKNDLGKVIWYGGGSFDWDNIGNVHRGLDEVDQGKYNLVEESEIFSGACVLIKKEALEILGGMDKKYFLYFEDSDFARRAKNAGFKIFYNGQVSVYHKVSQSTGIGSELTDYYHTRNRLIFGMKYASLKTRIALLRETLWLMLFGRRIQRKGVLDFYLGVIEGIEEIKKSKIEYALKLSIVIVNYNTADLTKKLLESILSKDSGFNPRIMEVIILDNGNVDPCREKIKEYLPKIIYLKNEDNEGFSRGYNRTILYSKGQYVLLLNSDIEVMENSLTEMVKMAGQFKGEAVLGGKLFFPDKSEQDSVFHLPTISGAFKEYFLAKRGSYFMYQPKGEKPSKVDGLVMACFLIPEKVLNKVGLLDEETFIFFEDIEYCNRLKKYGTPLYFIPTAKFIHHHGASTKGIGQEKAYGLLKKAAEHYHGRIYYHLLTFVLRIGQKLDRVKTPVSRWTKS